MVADIVALLADAYNLYQITELQPFIVGHIHDSYKVITPQKNYFLQRVNHLVFKNVPGLMENALFVTDLYTARGNPRYPRFIRSTQGQYYYQRVSDGTYWRLMDFVDGSISYNRTTDLVLAEKAGAAIGQFHRYTDGTDPEPFCVTIPGFQDIGWRYQQFRQALADDRAGKKLHLSVEIDFALAQESWTQGLYDQYASGAIPRRLVHNDTKLNNILFDDRGDVIGLIDLDTVMSGCVWFDTGDALRGLCSNLEEDDAQVELMQVNLEVFRAFHQGYLAKFKHHLTPAEVHGLPYAAAYMAFIMGLRFLTDYLNGNIYYRIHYPEHNLDRCHNQFHFVAENLRLMGKLKGIMEALVG